MDFRLDRIEYGGKEVGYEYGYVKKRLIESGLWEEFCEFMQGKELIVSKNRINNFIKPSDFLEFINKINKK